MNRSFGFVGFVFTFFVLTSFLSAQTEIASHLQDVSVTIKAQRSEGSGVLITRELKVNADDEETVKVNFVWTAAHVIDSLKSSRKVVDAEGQTKTVVEFKDAYIVKELVEDGRRVGELKMDAKVIAYSDADNGQDLAILMVRKKDFVSSQVEFVEDKPLAIGTQLYHVGSLLGQDGANSMTTGILSQIGRVLDLGSGDGVVFDQTTCAAFPGSSGGGIFTTDGKYVGMLVRGAGETFNLMVPVRRMRKWADKRGLLWAIDTNIEVPSLEEIKKIEPEDEYTEHVISLHSVGAKEFNFLIKNNE